MCPTKIKSPPKFVLLKILYCEKYIHAKGSNESTIHTDWHRVTAAFSACIRDSMYIGKTRLLYEPYKC